MKNKAIAIARSGKAKIAALGGVLLASVTAANATAVDMSGITTGLTDQITESFTTAVPIIAMVLGLTVGIKLIKRFAR